MAGRLDWRGPQAQEKIRAEMGRRLAACAILVATRAKRLLSVAGTIKAGQGRDAKGRSKRAYGSNPSAPGEPPHKQTGRLRASVAFEVVGLVARVGTNVRYGRWLELGTRLVAARPWLRRALAECRSAIRATLGKKM